MPAPITPTASHSLLSHGSHNPFTDEMPPFLQRGPGGN
jgi:hypothetical protein